MALQAKLISSLEKCFVDEHVSDKPTLQRASMLRNERYSFQVIFADDADYEFPNKFAKVEVRSELAPYVTMRIVEHVPNQMPCYPGMLDDDYLRTEPGLYPDPLVPMRKDGLVKPMNTVLRTIWMDIDPKDQVAAGVYPVEISLAYPDGEEVVLTLELTIMPADLPAQETIVTQWFHTDCLANYYNVPVFSEKHWEIVGNFMKMAAEHGQNVIYLPVFTPPLDTKVGGERTTVQLVDIVEDAQGYHFNFDKSDRWCELALGLGFQYFEVCHLYTQWGAAHAPKIYVEKDGALVKRFGWETDSLGEDYKSFLRSFLKAFIGHMKEKGWNKLCRYHISDEPFMEHLQTYRMAKENIADLLAGYVISDALSDFEFYKLGIVETPTPSSDHIQPFLDAGVKDLATYYCCGQWKDTSNRFLTMPGYRTRVLGVQMYRNDVDSFLQWGYNFYNNAGSVDAINPWLTSSGDYDWPGGDPFIVYPAPDGTPYASLRLLQFADAFQDIRALKLCEKLCGREFVNSLIDREGAVRFDKYPQNADYLLKLRQDVNAAIANAISK